MSFVEEIHWAEQHHVLGIYCARWYKERRFPQYEGTLLDAMARVQKYNELSNRTIAFISRLLHTEGISPILLKGQGLLPLYAEGELRQSGDIDLYIPPHDYDRAVECLLRVSDGGIADETDKHICFRIHGIDVELHRYAVRLYGKDRHKFFLDYTRENLTPSRCRTVNIGGEEVLVPSLQYNALYLFLHLWDHIEVGGATVSQFFDLRQVLSRSHELDLVELHRQLRSLRSERQWNLIQNCATPEEFCRLVGDTTGLEKVSVSRWRNLLHYHAHFLRLLPLCGTPLLWRYFAFMRHKLYWALRQLSQ